LDLSLACETIHPVHPEEVHPFHQNTISHKWIINLIFLDR
jgi:hypothetical protein